MAVEHRGDLGDQAGPVEHLPASHELTLRIQQVRRHAVDLRVGQLASQAPALLAGAVQRRGKAFEGPAVGFELGDPTTHELVGAGAALDRPVAAGGDVAGPVARVAHLFEVVGDLVRALGEDVAHLDRDPHDPPIPSPPRPSPVGLDRITQLDGLGRRAQPTHHRRRLVPVPQLVGPQCLVAALGVAHLAHVGDQHMIMQVRITLPGRAMPCHRVHQPRRRGRHHDAAPPPALGLCPALQVAHGASGLGVQDDVHVIGPVHHAHQRQRLVRRHHQLEPRPLGAHQPLAGERVPEPTGPKRQPVCLPGHLAL
jgi:hypothetical protein